MKKERDFKGVWIPKNIWLDKNLSWSEKLMLVEIDSLDKENGCFASNVYFSEFFGLSKVRVSQIINSLIKKEYIVSKVYYKGGTKEIDRRVLNISLRGYNNKVYDPIKENFKDNNTINNTSNNTINSRTKKEKKFIPPTFDEYKQYCKDHNFEHIAERSFKMYEVANWHDTKGNQIINWKQKLQSVWFTEKNNNNNGAKQNNADRKQGEDIFAYYQRITQELKSEREGSSNIIDID